MDLDEWELLDIDGGSLSFSAAGSSTESATALPRAAELRAIAVDHGAGDEEEGGRGGFEDISVHENTDVAVEKEGVVVVEDCDGDEGEKTESVAASEAAETATIGGNGASANRWPFAGVGALCSMGVAVAAVLVVVLGGGGGGKAHVIRFDERYEIKGGSMVDQATPAAVYGGGPTRKAQITSGGYFKCS